MYHGDIIIIRQVTAKSMPVHKWSIEPGEQWTCESTMHIHWTSSNKIIKLHEWITMNHTIFISMVFSFSCYIWVKPTSITAIVNYRGHDNPTNAAPFPPLRDHGPAISRLKIYCRYGAYLTMGDPKNRLVLIQLGVPPWLRKPQYTFIRST